MNNVFVFRGILVKFDELIGWFINDDNGDRFIFDSKDECLEFIRTKIIKK